jgi:hypothetical protein
MSVFSKRRHVLDTEVDGFADVGEGFGYGLALGVAARDGGSNHDVAAVVLVGLEKNFEIAGGHGFIIAPDCERVKNKIPTLLNQGRGTRLEGKKR